MSCLYLNLEMASYMIFFFLIYNSNVKIIFVLYDSVAEVCVMSL